AVRPPLPPPPCGPSVPIPASSLAAPALTVASGAVPAQLVPPGMLGRIGALLTVTGMGLAPLGPLVAGVLAGSLGGGWALVIAGTGFVLTGAVGALSPTLREFRAEG